MVARNLYQQLGAGLSAFTTSNLWKRLRPILFSTIVSAVALLWFAPIFWIISISLKPNSVAALYPVTWIPNPVTLENYETILFHPGRGVNIVRSFGVSVFVCTAVVIGVLLVSAPAAYAFARLKFRGRNTLFWLIVATLALPVQMFIVPVYVILDRLDLVNKLPALILPPLGPAFALFVLRQFMLAVSTEMEDAARLDGCNSLQVLVHIVVPQIRPALVSVGLITFLTTWNDFLWPLIVIYNRDIYPLTLALNNVRSAYHFTFEAGTVMASFVVVVIPVIVLFFFAKNYLVKGISLSGTGSNM
jgi:multiple sugar transport system permease protein